ncbi:phosphatidate cytidylyltransferase [Flavobacteriaceae bacterium]|nr:phosphatidate cytidylyltransferase [Flavobacteriaceae bacterium]MDA7741283.1 phosphatidate cytidylyltransferase [Flavobacteriaceae bacterium]MDA8630233.1 phosphatidate cytidylyltransferase [Flavobacteriaceae bacterium]MDA9084438.1 phosphatidate cytidylyltransferase [Flavobacteriaceae bacterium]MDC0559463.1 phosphatidate cytidylyltransferase [Flavobacteriaceae bacterium]
MINFLPRLITGIAYISLVTGSIIYSSGSFLVVFILLTLLATYESHELWKKIKLNNSNQSLIFRLPQYYVFQSMTVLAIIPFSFDELYNPFPILLIFILIWISDTMSYFFGSYFGKTKMKIKASPNKTWEGFVGGFLCSITFSIISFNYIQEIYPFWKTVSLGILIPIFGLIGDIYQSKIKRMAGVKDSGTILPGHGGVLDRLDSAMGVSYIVLIITLI